MTTATRDPLARYQPGQKCPRCRRTRLPGEQRCPCYRRPPRPPYGMGGCRAREGIVSVDGVARRRCALCGTLVSGRRRTWCSEGCVHLWNIASDGRYAFHELARETGPVCWVCGKEPAAEVDHVRPLFTLSPAELEELRWWLPFNLQLIGRLCHRAKTAREAAMRARCAGAVREAAMRVERAPQPARLSLFDL